MKYIRYFKENVQEEENLEQYKDIEKLFEDDNWLVIKPKTSDSLDILVTVDGELIMDTPYDITKTYLNINKKSNEKILLDFKKSDFYDEDNDQVYLKEFFEKNYSLFKFYGELITCNDIKKEGEEYWIVVNDYTYFVDYFKLDNRTRNDLIEKVLGGDSYELFEYNPKDFSIDENFKLNEDKLKILKAILRLEAKENSDYNYDVKEVKDYDDVVSIVKEYDIDNLEIWLKYIVCRANEYSDANKAYEDITDEIYSFFGLVIGSAKWVDKKSQSSDLWLKFKDNDSAYYAKFLIENYDDSYSDDKIEYSPPYYGYNGDHNITQDFFNQEISEILDEYGGIETSEINDYLDYMEKTKEENPDSSEEELEELYDIYSHSKKFNI